MDTIRLLCSLVAALLIVATTESRPIAYANQAESAWEEREGAGLDPGSVTPSTQPQPVGFAKGVKYGAGFLPSSVAIGDFNGDGHLDVAVADECELVHDSRCQLNGVGTVSVLLGNGNGSFRTAVSYSSGGSFASSIVAADVNRDGKVDLIVSNQCRTNDDCSSGDVSVLLGNGDGTFKAPVNYDTGGYAAVSVAVGDVNGDHKLDLVVANACVSSPTCTVGSGPSAVSILLGKAMALSKHQ